ncbi:hypothetical protein U9M48_030394 [Paspalum notatum var. saurae]|uniref:Reverse transcriptase domain-containing protein n=1 Tax=Paspalum notatum var. saurae TaxID=547442 RepID=A0AAQ3U4T6_PASNO
MSSSLNEDLTGSRETEEIQDDYMNSITNSQEIIQIINNTRSDASPGPDGLNAAFYNAAWSWIADDVVKLIQQFYRTGTLPAGINSTHIALIPKCNNTHAPQNFRPISLCNVIYKIISKSLAERIKIHLPNYIHSSQSAFIPGRHITSNIIITQEITNLFILKTWNQKAFLLQLDLGKAFHRIEWNFIVKALKNRGFANHFINLITSFISSPSFSILINGQPYYNFKSQRGIRQGCPLSPYLFVLAINELSCNLQQAMRNREIQGISLGPDCSHSLTATQQEAQSIKEVLHNFCLPSGQTPNWNKSAIHFSKKVSQTEKKNIIRHIFPAPLLTNNSTHLGHPLLFSYKDRAAAYNFILNNFYAKISYLKANKLNHAGRLIYLRSVLASIPIYYMANILFPANFMHKIDSIMRNFWWAGVQDENSTHPIAFRSWDDICTPKVLGGLGLKKMSTVNRRLVLHSAWMIVNGKDPFLTSILKSKYFHNSSFWKCNMNGPKSVFRSSIQGVKNQLVAQVINDEQVLPSSSTGRQRSEHEEREQGCTSTQVQDGVDPLTAETLAMKLAIKIIHSLGQNDCFYYTDSQILVDNLNSKHNLNRTNN